MLPRIAALLALSGWCATSVVAQTVVLDFKNDTVTGGTLNILTEGSGAVDSFKGNRFDEQQSSNFQITGVTNLTGPLEITASALGSEAGSDLNVTADGLQDGSSGYDSAGEGTQFSFSSAVVIRSIDWGSFTDNGVNFDQVELRSGPSDNLTSIGSFKNGDTLGSIDFSSTNPSTMAIELGANDVFEIKFMNASDSNGFWLESISFDVVPESELYGLLLGTVSALLCLLRRRR